MNGFKVVWDFLDGKKRILAVGGGVVLAWANQYHLMPEMWANLANSLYTVFGGTAIAHAWVKGSST